MNLVDDVPFLSRAFREDALFIACLSVDKLAMHECSCRSVTVMIQMPYFIYFRKSCWWNWSSEVWMTWIHARRVKWKWMYCTRFIWVFLFCFGFGFPCKYIFILLFLGGFPLPTNTICRIRLKTAKPEGVSSGLYLDIGRHESEGSRKPCTAAQMSSLVGYIIYAILRNILPGQPPTRPLGVWRSVILTWIEIHVGSRACVYLLQTGATKVTLANYYSWLRSNITDAVIWKLILIIGQGNNWRPWRLSKGNFGMTRNVPKPAHVIFMHGVGTLHAENAG